MSHPTLSRLHRFAEAVIAGLLAIIFIAFLVQIVFRYAFNLPVGWTAELSVAAWLWLVLWGSAFVLKESEEIRFDLLYSAVSRPVRRVMGIVISVALVGLYGMSFPAVWKYVTFMKVESSSYLHIRMDWMYSIYIVFAAAIILRYVWIAVQWLRNQDPEVIDPTKVGSGL